MSATGFRHRTSDHWEAAALWAKGWPVADTEMDNDGRTVFIFPNGGAHLRKDVEAYRPGELKISALAMRQAFYHARALIGQVRRHASHQ